MGNLPGIKAFVAAVLGGIGNIPGAALGGLIIGILETLVVAIGFPQWRDGIAFAILILILLFKPAGLLGKATEDAAHYTGPRIGSLLNATLGNAAELIITIMALRAGLFGIVKASIAGSIIGNVLVVLGASLLVGGLRHGIQTF